MAISLAPDESERSPEDTGKAKYTVFCCQGGDCTKNGAREALKALRAEIRRSGLKHDVQLIKTECTDHCKDGPIVIVGDAESSRACGLVWYRKVHPKDAALIANEHLLNAQPVEKKRLTDED